MTKIITAIVLFICSLLSAQTQFEKGMTKAGELWKEGKTDEASAMYERIASAEKSSWLPNYYVALVNTTTSFSEKDKTKASLLLNKAQDVLDEEMIKDQENSELYVMQALIYTAWVVQDPMTNGQKYSAKVMEAYAKAKALNPNNPRAVFGEADYQLGGAKWTGADTKPLCEQINKSIELFGTFKPETPMSPNWGLERALEVQKTCK
ncbi:tetratricopeptide repeat protein [Flavobacterium adhaerens]|uniref:tetratricopeptide repeat protein n=1 Tax=Flavobacterium adhaerens TaxID=3149043 RepID=UPI0032B5CB9A